MPSNPGLTRGKSRWIVAVLAAVFALAGAGRAVGNDAVRAASDLQAKYAAEIEQLAAWCESNGLAEQAKKTRSALSPTDPYKIFIPVLPDAVGRPKLSPDAPAKVVDWDSRLWRLRCDHATALYDMANRVVRSGRAGLAFQLALAAIQANPDHEPARRLFGYQKFHGQWRTAYETRKLRAGCVWSDRFGWLPKGDVQRYEQGERLCDGRWVSAAEDARRHADIGSGWKIDTEHYTIRTNHSIEAGVSLGVKVERLYRIWQQLFIRYYASEADVVAMFDGRSRPGLSPRYSIVYFRDRDDYNRTLLASTPKIGITAGVYDPDGTRRVYFFAGEEAGDRNLYHEATHQLFCLSRLISPEVVRKGNFWIVEGIAMFMESLRQEDGYFVLGGVNDERIQAARYRLLHDNFYVPLDDLIGYDMHRLQNDPRIGMLYSESAGLTAFLVFDGGGRYRDALVSYLSAVYTARDDHGTLARFTGQSLGELDKQYRAFAERGKQAGE